MARVFTKGHWVLSTLLIFNMLYLLLCFEKNCKIVFSRSLTSVSENISVGSLITEKRSFKNLKMLSILARFISKIKKADISDFPSVKYFVKHFLFLKIWNIRANDCGNYGPLNLLFCFTGQNLEKINNRQRETAVNSLVRYFES